MAKQYDKIALIADFKTGQYTLRKLGQMYGISKTQVNNVTKEISQENKELVDKQIEINHKLMFKTSQEVDKIEKVVQFETDKHAKFKAKLDLFSDVAMAKGLDLLNNSTYGADYKAIVDGMDKHSVTMGFNDRFNKNAMINNTNAQQNTSETLERVIKNLPD